MGYFILSLLLCDGFTEHTATHTHTHTDTYRYLTNFRTDNLPQDED